MEITFESYFKDRNPEYEFLLSRMRCAIEVEEVKFSDINSLNMIKFKNYMMGEVGNNSLKTYFAVLKAAIKSLFNDGLIPNATCLNELRVKSEPSENVFLTEEELARMDAYFDKIINNPHVSQGEKDCLCLFLLENVTGARASDCINLSEDNIKDGKLTYISKKTRQKSVMPVHRNLLKYLRYKPAKDYSRMHKNRVIKSIAKKCGITQVIKIFYRGKWRTGPKYMFAASHTGRRDFATHLSMRGAPITEICQYMNHKSNLNQTMRYIVPDYDNVSNEARSFFDGESLK